MFHHVILFLLFKQTLGDCVCVPFWKCEDTSADSEELDFSSRNTCKGHFDVCCRVKCGKRRTESLVFSDARGRILGAAHEANFAEFPWMLGVISGNSYRCGASLIHPKVALTAAHCVQAGDGYVIRAGEWDWSHANEPLRHQDRRVSKVIIHPQFSLKSLVNDIAVVIVERAFRMGDHVGVVCLPPQNSAPIPEECVVTGWGKTSYKSVNGFENVLKKGNFPVVHNDDCEAALQGALLGPGFRLHDSFMCAGGGPKKDACKGDGGSPLVCLVEGEEDRYEQFGIVAWGLVCGLTDAPGVYVGVARFIDWIDRQMATHHLDPQIYKYH